MKKCLRTSKKALSVFMAVLMAFTAMVFAAPQPAIAVDEHTHAFSEYVETIPATCTESGYVVYKCSVEGCGVTYRAYDDDHATQGHEWGDWKVTKAATNTETGTMERKCTVCDEVETATIPAGRHSFNTAKGTIITNATCHSTGLIRYACTSTDHENCGVYIDVTIAETPHTLSTKLTYPKCERTYDENGTYTDSFTDGKIEVYCINGGCSYVDETATVNLKIEAHNWGEYATLTEATCGAAGRKVRYCKNCGAADYSEIPPTQKHNFVETKTYAPTCTERGYTIYECDGCTAVYRDNFVDALKHNLDDGTDIAATCTEPGGTLYTCKREYISEKVVDGEVKEIKVPCGYTEFVEDPERPKTGHNVSGWEYVAHPSVDDAYAKWRQCMNAGCTFTEYEKGEADSESVAEDGVNIYYKVNYYNEWVTDTYDVLEKNKINTNPTTIYTKLAKTYKTECLASIYVLKGEAAVYPNKLNPVREKDVDYGGYTFEGWTEESGKQRLNKDATVEPAETADLSKITANTDVYALFRCKDVYYPVRFCNPKVSEGNPESTPLTTVQLILHGHSAEWPEEYGEPTMPENIYRNYKFTGWTYDYTAIYDEVNIIAEYETSMKEYVLVYHDWNGTELGRETIYYGGSAKSIPTPPERGEDSTYIYKFLNTWSLSNGATVNLENFTEIPSDAKEGDEINVYANHSQRLKVYKVTLQIWDPYGMTCGGATVQVLNSKGQLVASTTTDADSYAYLSLNYSTVYTVKISRGNYALEGTMSLDPLASVTIPLTKDLTAANTYYNYNVTLKDYTNDDDKPSDTCSCACHSFIGGIWIAVLNILYRVFKVKQVCCYDMYIVHGDKLVYGPN